MKKSELIKLAKEEDGMVRVCRMHSGGITVAPYYYKPVGTISWSYFDVEDHESFDYAAYGIEIDDDPTPWCSACNAMKQADCKCGPIAEND